MGSVAATDSVVSKEHNSQTNTDLYPEGSISTSALLQEASTSLIRPGGAFLPLIVTRASGVFVYTADGHRILDFTSGQMSCLIGHGHPEIVNTITAHAAQLDHLFSGMLSPPVLNLAERLMATLQGTGLDKTMFLSTGGEANEAAIKMAKLYTGKWEIVGLGGSWHGMTDAARGATMPGNLFLPTPNGYRSRFRHPDGSYDWEAELDYGWSMVDQISTGSLAAVIIEPILSSGGMLVLPPGYMAAMKRHCRKREMLLIVDEAQTAIRCGDMYAFQHPDNGGTIPDILTLSKTLGNGIPLSAVVTTSAIESICAERGFLFYTTHLNDPLPAAVGAKVLEIVQRDNLVVKSRELGQKLHARLRSLQEMYLCIGDVRGRGLMAGVEIVSDRQAKTPGFELGKALSERMYELGLSANLAVMPAFGGVFRIAPPITITEEELMMGLDIMEEAFRTTVGTRLDGK
ncbi:hypothetical protein BC1G_04988 [Paecilomyces variotii No. 5]|uniref:2,2-dialkylglycine decarboxylase n=1 Tax=Byssochlamys spectabilis (strain No. 5 / NBRC 109023) TaxID=1356009 RepID=V5HYA3_BYSSN|nr:hypothetical protein BC1G_04988 [Paecilomyces variotii No. 5]